MCLYSWEACKGNQHPFTPLFCGVVTRRKRIFKKPLHCVLGLRCARLSFLYRVGVAPNTRARLASRRATLGTLAGCQLFRHEKSLQGLFPCKFRVPSSFSAFQRVVFVRQRIVCCSLVYYVPRNAQRVHFAPSGHIAFIYLASAWRNM